MVMTRIFVPNNSTPENELIKLKNCNCCNKHKLNKPTELVTWIELPMNHNLGTQNSNKNYDNTLICKCDCRHKARWICRTYKC